MKITLAKFPLSFMMVLALASATVAISAQDKDKNSAEQEKKEDQNKKVGPMGPAGPMGPMGPAGPMGLPGAAGAPGADAPVAYGVGTVNVKRGANAPSIWAAYSTRLGSPLGLNFTDSAIGGDTTGGAFRFTCNTSPTGTNPAKPGNDHNSRCELSVAAATLSSVAGETVYVYPRVLIQTQALGGGQQTYCEYGDGSVGAAFALVSTQAMTATPVYTPMMVNIGGSADCSGPVSTAGDVNVITVGPGYYDVFTTFVFKKQ